MSGGRVSCVVHVGGISGASRVLNPGHSPKERLRTSSTWGALGLEDSGSGVMALMALEALF